MRNYVFFLVLFFSVTSNAQDSVKIFGKLLDQDGLAIAGANVKNETSQESVQTDAQGHFEFLQSTQLPSKLYIQAGFFIDKQLSVNQQNFSPSKGIIIYMETFEVALDEVLITGRRNNSYLVNTVVMGGKFAGTLKNLPQSVSLVSREFMEDKQAFVVTDMINDLAGVNQASAYDDMTIRGFSSGYASGMRLVNGMRSAYGYGTSYWRTPMTANLESIEVLKGPGASLFGDIAPGGTINLVTKKPLEEQKSEVNIAVGSFQTFRTTLDLGGPLDRDKKILSRFNLGYENSHTFRDNNQRSSLLIAPSFTFKPKDGTQLDLDMTYDNFDGFLDRGIAIRNNAFYQQDRAFNVNQSTDFYKAKFLTFSARFSQQILKNLSLQLNYMKSIYDEHLNELRTLNSYADAPENTILNMRFQARKTKEYVDNFVSYFKYDWKKNNHQHRFVLGFDYAQYRPDKNSSLREARSYRNVDGDVLPLTVNLNTGTNNTVYEISSLVWRPQPSFPFLNPYQSYGIYLQDQMDLGEKLSVIAGLRYEYYKSESSDLQSTYKTSQHAWLPRLGLIYKINPSINYFVSYSQGFVPVGADFIYNYQDFGSDTPFSSEKSYQVETGFKAGFFQNQLQTEISVFHIERSNMLINTGTLTANGQSIYRQSGKVVSSGVEVDFRGQITKEFQLMANFTYNPTKVKSSSIASEIGQGLGNAPRYLAGLWAKYVFSETFLKGLGFGAGFYHTSARRMENSTDTDANGQAIWSQWPSYNVVNTALYYHINKLRFTVNFNNIFDKYYYLGGFDYTRGFVGTPRNVMVSMGYSF